MRYITVPGARIVVPVHEGRGIKPKTLAGVIKDMGITVEEFAGLLQGRQSRSVGQP